jgi:chemotaxis protein CheD
MLSHPVIRDVLLQPGEYAVRDATCRIRTVLGSCVSITLWHEKHRVGAMSHFLLATRGLTPGHTLDARYGEEALTLMLRDLALMGVPAEQCQAKIFGGANMFAEVSRPGVPLVGRRNGESARNLLRGLGIPIQSESLFGCGHRQIVFDVASGDVWSRQVRPASDFSQAEG